ncbi:MAG: dTDP-4-amino-4,6-dideoxygalactose transaminase [Candidatus Zixiibacteriota bacterium]|nr:MAG: dTDP-4-amino-4,6-dideoxygalactose transaminase [candidate division Zixibacteria bacterium]
MRIPFNQPYLSGNEERYLREALLSRAHCGNRAFGDRCVALMRERCGFGGVFLTPSCTAAMEMGALLADLRPGDEVILPSWTFSSTANAVVLRGARPLFCEIEPDTMNLDVARIEALVTPRTRMILPIDYMGIPCDLEPILQIAAKYHLVVMEDAAQAFGSRYRDQPCGSLPPLAAFSFHESKNLSCGEGGALVVNDPEMARRAPLLQEKGTDRSLVLKGERVKYSWVDLGSSFLLADLLAALLLAQLEAADRIMEIRSRVTHGYEALFAPYAARGCVRLPRPPAAVRVNHHAYFVIFDNAAHQESFLALCREREIYPYRGYLPLHSSAMGKSFGYRPEDLPLTEDLAARLVRLPFYTDLADEGLDYCLEGMHAVLRRLYGN